MLGFGSSPVITSSNSSSSSSMAAAAAAAAAPPPMPSEPGPEECCQRGCKVCVWDVYRDSMDAWRAYMQQHHPAVLLPDAKGTPQRRMIDASMDAFEAMERQLQHQQQQRQQEQQEQQERQHQQQPSQVH